MPDSSGYDARRGCGIDVVDPGAVPGGSTKIRSSERSECYENFALRSFSEGGREDKSGQSSYAKATEDTANSQTRFASSLANLRGAETGSTRVVKAFCGVRHGSAVIGPFDSCK